VNARQLEVFRAIMRTGSVTDAARLLNVSQPSVSKVIRHAEAQIGVRLFKRIRGRLYPTPEAELLFPDADRVFRDLEALRHLANELRDGHAGLLRVAASSTTGATVLPQVVARFRAVLPGVKVVFHVLPAAEVRDLIVAHEIELGLTVSPVTGPGVRVQSIGSTEMVCILPRGHPLAQLRAVGPADLVPYPLVSFNANTYFGHILDEAYRSQGMLWRTTLEVNMSLPAIALVRRGVGVALVDALIVGDDTADVVVRPFRPTIRLPVNLLTSEVRPRSHFAERFIEYLREQVGRATAVHAPRSFSQG
jgi:DNA-binding transcriptional LysR family regulator